MRSIRRSLLGYLLLLLALALGAVGVLVARFANAAVRAREASETERIEQTFKVRQQEAKTKFDADLLAEAKGLAKEVQYKTAIILGQNLELRRLTRVESLVMQIGVAVLGQSYDSRPPRPGNPRFPEPQPPVKAPDEEARLFRARTVLMDFAAPPTVLPTVLTLSALEPRLSTEPRRYNPFPGWVEYDTPRLLVRVQESLRKTFDDDDHPGGFQITLVGGPTGRAKPTLAIPSPVRLGGDRVELPLDPVWLTQAEDSEPRFDDVVVPNKGTLRRVVMATTANGRPLSFAVWLAPPTIGNIPPRPIARGPHVSLRVFVHVARPHTELDARLVADQKERDEQLANVQEETRAELVRLRSRLWLIGGGTFLALVLGGWFFVARGLSPLRKLSDAVSRVSEKDFRLTVGPAELGRELAPIHARITQTLTLLQRAFAREKQAVADISHELRTPIASLLATIDVALRKPRTPDQYRTALEECRLISKQLGQLVERIMTLASLDAGNDHTNTARVDANELVAGCAAVIRPLAANNNLTLSVQLDDDLILDTDSGKLREVLMNLLHNAVEYNKPGGTIELAARRDGPSAVFEVRDSGIGMAPEVKEKIFERFYRADSSRHSTGIHAGLGLAIVKEYIARLNGVITVESQPGAGTTFRVVLSATPSQNGHATERSTHCEDAVPAGS